MGLPEGDEGIRTILAVVPERPLSWGRAMVRPEREAGPRPGIDWSEPAADDVGPGA